ncbi:hypothetical protein GCM10010214_31770 [Streptomyces abikoensis]|nr:hypothetical protein GCM10010214_31770 [Streptomyces abikoensis]
MIRVRMESTSPGDAMRVTPKGDLPQPAGRVECRARRGQAWLPHTRLTRTLPHLWSPAGRPGPQGEAPVDSTDGGLPYSKVDRPAPKSAQGGDALTQSWRQTARLGGHAYA